MSIFSRIFFSDEKRSALALVLDIGSSSVGAALFQLEGSKIPKIIFSTREYILPREKAEIGELTILTVKALDLVCAQVAALGKGVPDKIFCTLSSLWYVSQTRHILFKQEAEFVFTDKLADGLIVKEISLFESEREGAGTSGSMRPIEVKTIRTTLNGYETFNPRNQKARELEITLFISLSPEEFLKKIEDSIHKCFHEKKIIFSSFVAASFAVTRDMYSDKKDFLLFDISAEVTDISMVKDNILRESISFPLGRNFMLRGVANTLGGTLEEASSMLSLYNDGHAGAGVKETLDPILNKLKGEWLKNFQSALSTISNDISIPSTIFITVNKEFAEFFSEIITNEQFNQYTLTDSKFSIIFLDSATLHKVANFEDNIARDPFLILEAVYINRFLNKV